MMAAVDLDGKVLNVNLCLARVLGEEVEALVGRNLDALLERARPRDVVTQLVAGVTQGSALTEIALHLNGEGRSARELLASVTPIRQDGLVCGASLVLADVTEQRAFETTLRESEDKLRIVVEGSPGFFFYIHDRDGVFTYLSPSVERITGRTVEEWKRHYTEYLTDHPVNDEVVRNTERTLRDGSGDARYPVEILHRDGHRVLLQVYERPIVQDGAIVGIQGVAQDVTEIDRARHELLRVNRALRTLSDGTQAVVEARSIDDLCARTVDIFTLVGGFPFALITLGRQGPAHTARHSAIGIIPHLAPHESGQEVRALLEAEVPDLVPGVPEKPPRVAKPIVRRLETAPLQETVAADDGGLSRPDSERASSRRLRELGIKALAVLPLRQDEEDWGALYLAADDDDAFTPGEMSLLEKLSANLSFGINTLNAEAQRLATAETLQQREHELRQAQKMEAVGQLAGGIAHDFNNLLTVLNGYLRLLEHDLQPVDSGRAYLDECQNAIRRAGLLTRQLLAFSRRQVMEPRTLDLNEAVRGMERMFARLIGENISLTLDLQEALPPVFADASQIEQVLLNLAVNARDAMPHGGQLEFRTRVVDSHLVGWRAESEPPPARLVELVTQDTGHGMNTEVAARAFEPFFTTKGVGRGSGLGLSTVYGIIKQHAGHIEVSSQPGEGSRFRILLPALHEAAPEPALAAPVRAVASGRETVLVVEDEDVVRGVIVRVLAGYGYDVLAADSPRQALHISRTLLRPLHLLVTDLMLPSGTGETLYQELREERPGLKVLYISGYYEHAAIVEHVGAPRSLTGENFLPKPFEPEELAARVRAALDGTPETVGG